jgi:hypothetical protein
VGRAMPNSSNSNRKPLATSAGDNDSHISLCISGQVIPKAHNGLLRVATAMESLVTSHIEAHMSSNASSHGATTGSSKIRIILTGHSAGGGVTALVYLGSIKSVPTPPASRSLPQIGQKARQRRYSNAGSLTSSSTAECSDNS